MSGSPGRLVVVGSVIGDLLIRVPALPSRGGDMVGRAEPLQAGGGFIVLAAAARLGMPTALLGLVGTGPVGDVLVHALAQSGTELLLPRADADTGLCLGLVEPDGERTFVTSPGVEATLRPEHLREARLAAEDVVYVSGYDLAYPVSGVAIEAWLPRVGSDVVFDPGPLVAEIPRDRLDAACAGASILTLNARELRLLTGIDDPDLALARAVAMVPSGAAVIARDGRRGCVVACAGTVVRVPAPAVVAVDTTGAGDTHTGALVAGLRAGHGMVEADRRANAAAAFSVTRLGSATGPTSEELADCLT